MIGARGPGRILSLRPELDLHQVLYVISHKNHDIMERVIGWRENSNALVRVIKPRTFWL